MHESTTPHIPRVGEHHLPMRQTKFAGPLILSFATSSKADGVQHESGSRGSTQFAGGDGPKIDPHFGGNHPQRAADNHPLMLRSTHPDTLQSTTARSLLTAYVHHIWRLVRIGERKPKTITSYASMTGIVPGGFRFTPREQNVGERNFGAIWDLDIREATPRQLRNWMLDVAEAVREGCAYAHAGVTTANRCLTLLDSAIKHAIAEGVLSPIHRPTGKVERFKEVPRTRYLEPSEVIAIRDAVARVEQRRADTARVDRRPFVFSTTQALQLISLTAMRLQEALRLRVDAVHLDSRVIKLPDSKTGAGEVPLSTAAVDLLRAQLPRAWDGWMFPSIYGGPISSVYDVWDEVLRESGINPEGVVIHTFRHTVATLLKRADVPLEFRQRILRHRSPTTTERAYEHVTVTRGVLCAVDYYADMISASPSRGSA